MEALVLALVVVAMIVVVLWLLRRPQRRRAGASTSSRHDLEPAVIVTVDLPAVRRAPFVSALALRLDEPIRVGAGAHSSMVPPPSTRDHVVVHAHDGDRTLDAVLAELYERGFRVESAEGHAIDLSDRDGTEATVTVRAAGADTT